MSQEGGVNPRLYQMLLGGLRSLAADNSPVVRAGVLLEAAVARGLPPDPRPLRRVRQRRARSWPSTSSRAACCAPTTGGAPGSRPRRSTCCSASSAVSSPPRCTSPSRAATHEVDHLATRALEHHLERRLQSVACSMRPRPYARRPPVRRSGLRGHRRLGDVVHWNRHAAGAVERRRRSATVDTRASTPRLARGQPRGEPAPPAVCVVPPTTRARDVEQLSAALRCRRRSRPTMSPIRRSAVAVGGREQAG